MNNSFVLCVAFLIFLPVLVGPVWGQDAPLIREIGLPEPSIHGDHRIFIADLLEDGEDPDQLYLIQQPSFGTLTSDGASLLFQPAVDFETAGGDVFVYGVNPPRQSGAVRLAFLSPEPWSSESNFAHGFEGTYDGWDIHPDLEQPNRPNGPRGSKSGDPESIFSFVSDGIVGGQSLEAKLTRVEFLQRAQDGNVQPIGTNGAWGGGTTVIVCPDDDPDGGEPSPSIPGEDGETVVYRTYRSGSEARLRVKREFGIWQARVEVEGAVCVPGESCETEWLTLEEGAPEHLNIGIWLPNQFESTNAGKLHFFVGSDFEGRVSIPFLGAWTEFDEHQLGVIELRGLARNRLIFDDLRIYGYFDPFEQRVADGFELGDFSSGWDDRSSAGGLLVDGPAALTGSWGLRADPEALSGGPEKVLKELVDVPAEDYGARFRIDTTGLDLRRGETLGLLKGSSSTSPEPSPLTLSLLGTDNGAELIAGIVDDKGNKHVSMRVPLPSGPHTVVLRWVAGDPGGFWIWRDGVLMDSLTLENPAARIKEVEVGMFDIKLDHTSIGNNHGFFKVDDFVAWSSAYSEP